ncbi:hypothetical protein CGRA01v4_10367 [Colletotrichum graminicola]|nr:hypothetical protein CGRA01v4_10367 [Colletotrichum graminicola]
MVPSPNHETDAYLRGRDRVDTYGYCFKHRSGLLVSLRRPVWHSWPAEPLKIASGPLQFASPGAQWHLVSVAVRRNMKTTDPSSESHIIIIIIIIIIIVITTIIIHSFCW